MSIEAQKPPRRRRSAEQTREDALSAAQSILVANGPEAVTLQAVAAAVGTSHANLIHHFGSAAGLQSALLNRMIDKLGVALQGAVAAWRQVEAPPAALVAPAFHAFANGGASLAVRIAASGDPQQLAAVNAALQKLIAGLEAAAGDSSVSRRTIVDAVLMTTLLALGDALIGRPFSEMLGIEADRAQKLAAEAITAWVDEERSE